MMQIKIHLQRFLVIHRLQTIGIVAALARACRANKTTVGNWRNGSATTIHFDHLTRLVEFLALKTNLPQPQIIQELLASAELWDEIVRCDDVKVHVGVYKRGGPRNFPTDMTARCDVEIATNLMKELAGDPDPPTVDISYVPLELTSQGKGDSGVYALSDETRKTAVTLFGAMRNKNKTKICSCIVGSQKVNLITECLVADLWGLEPFKPRTQGPFAPFYICYRNGDLQTPSAFGGKTLPSAFSVPSSQPGIYYYIKKTWKCCPYIEEKEDAGVVITTFCPGRHALEIALIGFSGWATAAIGKHFLENPDRFRRYVFSKGEREISANVCRFSRSPESANDESKFECIIDSLRESAVV